MLLNIGIAVAMMLATTAIHAGGMVFALHLTRERVGRLRTRLRQMHFYWIAGVVLLMFLVSLLEVSVWAAMYVALDAIEGFERALYFSMVTFTTLGYGDIVLESRWQLLAAFEAANGIIMFGWTTAIVIAVVQRVYFGGKHADEPAGTERSA
jgi:voltage-gated potassium channel Kch